MTIVTSSISSLGTYYFEKDTLGISGTEDARSVIEVLKRNGIVFYLGTESSGGSADVILKHFTDADLAWTFNEGTGAGSGGINIPYYESAVLNFDDKKLSVYYMKSDKKFKFYLRPTTVAPVSISGLPSSRIVVKKYLKNAYDLSPPLINANSSGSLSGLFKTAFILFFIVTFFGAVIAGIIYAIRRINSSDFIL